LLLKITKAHTIPIGIVWAYLGINDKTNNLGLNPRYTGDSRVNVQ